MAHRGDRQQLAAVDSGGGSPDDPEPSQRAAAAASAASAASYMPQPRQAPHGSSLQLMHRAASMPAPGAGGNQGDLQQLPPASDSTDSAGEYCLRVVSDPLFLPQFSSAPKASHSCFAGAEPDLKMQLLVCSSPTSATD